MRKTLALIPLALGLVIALCAFSTTTADDADKKAKHTIKEVMKEAHGKKLLQKVIGGGASKEEKDKLLDLYISLLDNKPKKGEQDSWVMKAGVLTVAAARVAVGREGAVDQLKAASNCKGCHSVHK